MKIRIACVGKVKFDGLAAAIREYQKRIGAFAQLEIAEVKEHPLLNESEADIAEAIEHESDRLIPLARGTVIALSPEGKFYTSEEFSHVLTSNKEKGVTFLIGGSYGLSEKAKRTADIVLSFSPMTFPHQLFRLMLLEQIYRAFKIDTGQKYHK